MDTCIAIDLQGFVLPLLQQYLLIQRLDFFAFAFLHLIVLFILFTNCESELLYGGIPLLYGTLVQLDLILTL